jgi:hypothetical protein
MDIFERKKLKAEKQRERRKRYKEEGRYVIYKPYPTSEEKEANKKQKVEKLKLWARSPEGIEAIEKSAKARRKFETAKDRDKFWSEQAKIKRSVDLVSCIRGKLYQAKKRSKVKGIEFNITVEDVLAVYTGRCKYLDVELTLCNSADSSRSLSIDRIDNSLGYVKGNIQVISSRANSLKNNVPIDELSLFVENMKPRYKRKARRC